MDLSNAELQICFQNYHRALHDESYRDPAERVLTMKCSNGKNLKVLVEPSFTIYYVKLNIKYAYGRNIYPLGQQTLTDGEVVLENEVTLIETTILENGCLFLDMRSEEFSSNKKLEGEATTDSTAEIQKSAVKDDKNDVRLKGEDIPCLSVFGSSLKSLVESHDQATEEEVLTAVEGEEIGTRQEETKARDSAFKLEINSCVNVWQHDRVEINTPSYTSLTKISAATEQIFPIEEIPNEWPRLVWHPPWTWDVTHSPSNLKKFQTPVATQPIGVESLVAVHQKTHKEMMLLREKFLDSPFLAFNFHMGEKQSHLFKAVDNEMGEKLYRFTWSEMKMSKAGLEDLAVTNSGAGSILDISNSSHFTMLLTMTVDKLQNHTPRLILEDHGLHQILSSLCLLEVPELEQVFDYLEDMAAVISLASIWMSDCCEDILMRRMMELQWHEILREYVSRKIEKMELTPDYDPQSFEKETNLRGKKIFTHLLLDILPLRIVLEPFDRGREPFDVLLGSSCSRIQSGFSTAVTPSDNLESATNPLSKHLEKGYLSNKLGMGDNETSEVEVDANSTSSKRARDHAALSVDALVRFHRNFFVGMMLMGPTVGALISMGSCFYENVVVSSLIKCIRTPLVDEMESNCELYQYSIRNEEVGLVVKFIQEAASNCVAVDLSAKVTYLSADMTCRMVFGKKYKDKDLDEKGFKAIIQEAKYLGAIPNLDDYIPCIRTFDNFFEKIIDEHIQSKDENKTNDDFVDVMLRLMGSKESEYSIERSNIKAIILDMLAASMNTSAMKIEWALSELMKHPRVMKKLQKELENEGGLKRMVEEEDLDRLDYLSMVVKQSSLDSRLTMSAFAVGTGAENSGDWASKSLTATSAPKRSLGDGKKVLTMMPKHF